MPEQLSEEQAKELQEKIKRMSPEELREFQKQQCIFCQIVAGKVPVKKVYEDEHSITIMDINPAAPGHVLLLPKEHYAIMPQVPEKELGHLYLVAKYLSQVLLKVLKVGGTTVFVANGMVAGQRAQHFLLHLIPRKEGDGLLPSEEKYLEVNIQQKVQQLVEKRLNELLGVKKEVVRVEEKVGGEEKKVLPSSSGKAVKSTTFSTQPRTGGVPPPVMGENFGTQKAPRRLFEKESGKEVEAEFKEVKGESGEEGDKGEEAEQEEEAQKEAEDKEMEKEAEEEPEDKEQEEEEDQEKEQEKTSKSKKEKSSSKTSPAKTKSEEGISLDDIAKLFS